MLDLVFLCWTGLLLALGFKRPFLWVLGYIYVDILTPQKIAYGFFRSIPISLLFFLAAFGGWLAMDRKDGANFGFRQVLMLCLLCLCAYTTTVADFPVEAMAKWEWVWKSLVFAIFLPLTLRTRLRLEAATLIVALTVGSLLISSGIKTIISGGGYGTLSSYVAANSGIYEGSTLSTVAITVIPLIVWLTRYGTVFPPEWRMRLYALGLGFAALVTPIGAQTRTGLLCIGLLAVLALRNVKHRVLLAGGMGAMLVIALPFLPKSYTERMGTIETHQADTSASTRVAVWMDTLQYVKEHPMGGGFDAYLGNSIYYKTREVVTDGDSTTVETKQVVDHARAYHSAYFEVLGEQGWLGLILWLAIQITGIVQMELIRWRLRKSTDPEDRSYAALGNALQTSHLVYLLGSAFVGIAYQSFVFTLIGLEIALVNQVKRRAAAAREVRRPAAAAQLRPAGAQTTGVKPA